MIVDFLADADAFTLSEAVTNGRLRGYAEHFGAAAQPARTHAEVLERWESAREAARERVPSEVEFLRMLTDDAALGTELIAFVSAHLAGYNTPKAVHVIEEFPRTAVGKIQKHLLRERFSG